MPYERDQVLCDCASKSAFCLHNGKPGDGIKCMARDNWYTTLCSQGQCPGPMSRQCCGRCHLPDDEE